MSKCEIMAWRVRFFYESKGMSGLAEIKQWRHHRRKENVKKRKRIVVKMASPRAGESSQRK